MYHYSAMVNFFLTMQLMTKTFLIICLTAVSVYGQFRPNSIGVAYLTNETTDTYLLTIAFPIQTLEKENIGDRQLKDSIDYTGEFTFFDNYGELLTIKQKTHFKVQFWCENDGGIQFRPILVISIQKKNFKRKIQGINEVQNIACFVITNRTNAKVEPLDNLSKDIKLRGDLNNDGQIDCFLWTYYDEAENCSGEPKNNLGIKLQTSKGDFNLRCCGP
jgi:hypothetical protein